MPRSFPRALVTGGAGFIGSHVADALMARGTDVILLDDLSGPQAWGNVNSLDIPLPGSKVPNQATLVPGSICDSDLVARLFDAYAFDYVFHLAAYAAEGLSHHIKRHNYETNLIGSVNLINAAVNSGTVKCFVFTSSAAVYGHRWSVKQEPFVETDTPQPIDPYGIAKLAVEQELRATEEYFGLPFLIFRPHNVYGPRQNIGDRYRNVVGIFMNQALRGEPFTIFGEGLQARSFTYIDDVASLIAGSVDNPRAYNHVFNVGADEVYRVQSLAELVAQAMDVPCEITFLPERSEVRSVTLDHSRLRQAFHDLGHTTLVDGLAKMAAWAKTIGPQEPSTFDGIEITRNLPPSWVQPSVRS